MAKEYLHLLHTGTSTARSWIQVMPAGQYHVGCVVRKKYIQGWLLGKILTRQIRNGNKFKYLNLVLVSLA